MNKTIDRKAYDRAWREANPDRVAAYRAKAQARAQTPEEKERRRAHYLANRERILAKANAYHKANPERLRKANAAALERNLAMAASAKRMFELLPEGDRQEYAEWLLLLAQTRSEYAGLVRVPSLDRGYIAVYAGV